jgi:hypothetical protein
MPSLEVVPSISCAEIYKSLSHCSTADCDQQDEVEEKNTNSKRTSHCETNPNKLVQIMLIRDFLSSRDHNQNLEVHTSTL